STACQGLQYGHEICESGACSGFRQIDDCSVVPECQQGTCDDAGGCGQTPLTGTDCGSTACQGLLFGQQTCENGVCSGFREIADCSSVPECQQGTCDDTGGCGQTPLTGTDCGSTTCQGLLYGHETCESGACSGFRQIDDCDTGQPCLDICEPLSGCGQTPLTGPDCGSTTCQGLVFGHEACENGVCSGFRRIADCETDEVCYRDDCDPDDGCIHDPLSGTDCDDEDPCTLDDVCQDGQCTGVPKDCSHLDGPCVVGECNPLDGECVAMGKPEGSSCGTCRVCDSIGDCVQAEAQSFCVGPDECSPDGRCDADGVCIVEIDCDRSYGPGCEAKADYGPGENQRLDCRLPADALSPEVRVLDSSSTGGFVPVRIEIAQGWHKTIQDLVVRLSVHGAGLACFPDRAIARAGEVELEVEHWQMGSQVFFELASVDSAEIPAGMLQLDLVMESGASAGGGFEVDAWAPCSTQVESGSEHSLGCHAGYEPLRDDLVGTGMHVGLQRVSAAIAADRAAGVYRHDALEQEPPSGIGCQCGASSANGWACLALLLALGWLGRVRSAMR
ncbi:MAG: hypothetical protein JXR96_09060, partial [Deltaproteobacteria bacterium]|nr:hypothetical protein [Deltaproteobacteria bacterium]